MKDMAFVSYPVYPVQFGQPFDSHCSGERQAHFVCNGIFIP